MARFDLTDREWAILEPLLPKQPRRGGQWRDHRQVINGIAWVKRTGSPWRDMPERYGPWRTAHLRIHRWVEDGTWARLKAHVMALAEADGDIDWDAQTDSTRPSAIVWTLVEGPARERPMPCHTCDSCAEYPLCGHPPRADAFVRRDDRSPR